MAGLTLFATRAEAVAATIGSGVTELRTSGYYAAGDGGGATYSKVGSQPTHPGKLQSADGAWWKLVVADGGSVSVRQQGAKGDGVTDDSAAFVAAIAFLKATAANDSGTYKGSTRLYVPPGDYYMGTTTIDITHTLVIEGDSVGMVGGIASRLRWGTGCTGIRVQAHNTEGDHQISSPVHSSGAGSVIRGIFLQSGWVSGTGPYHAIDIMVRCAIVDVGIYNWEGNGINIVATAGGGAGYEGNANCFSVDRCQVYACKNGMYFAGADANAGNIISVDCSSNREWGFNDDSFLGNTFTGCHTASNVSGPYRTGALAGQTAIIGSYSEGNQPPSSLVATTIVIGGQHGASIDGSTSPAYLYGDSSGLVIRGDTKWKKGDTSDIELGNIVHVLDSWGNSSQFRFRYRGSPQFGYAMFYGDQSTGLVSNVVSGLKHSFTVNGTAVIDIDDAGINLASGKTLRVDGVQVGSATRVINAQTGTTYTPAVADNGAVVTLSNAAAITVTLPSNTTTGLPVGAQIDLVWLGVGQPAFVAGSGATVNSPGGLLSIASRYSTVTALKVSTNGWLLFGNLA